MESAGYDFIFADNEYVVNVPTLGIQLGIVAAITFVFFISVKGTGHSEMSYSDKLIIAKRKAQNHMS